MSRTRSHRRVHFLDEIRGFCIILMVFYHAFYTVGYIFNVSFAQTLFDFFTPAESFFAGVFVFLCGMSCRLSHSNLRRGLLLAAVALALSLVLWGGVQLGLLYRGSEIWFGILHCLAACILLYVLLYPTIRIFPPWLGLLISAALFILCFHVPSAEGGYFGIRGLFRLYIPAANATNPFLYPFGLCPVGPTGDYFPLLPWFFCFLSGAYAGMWGIPKWMNRSRFPFFSHVGRWSIWIYLAHQPVIYGACVGIFYLINLLK